MPIMAYTKKMLEAIARDTEIAEERRPLFERFVQAIGRQIRPPYHKRHTAEISARHLAALADCSSRRGSAPATQS